MDVQVDLSLRWAQITVIFVTLRLVHELYLQVGEKAEFTLTSNVLPGSKITYHVSIIYHCFCESACVRAP